MTHDTNLIIIHRHGHRGRQPGRRLRRDQRAVPESRVELGEIGEAAGDAVYAGMLGAVTEFAAAIRSEEHTSELQSLMRISYAVFCLKKTKTKTTSQYTAQN